MFKTKILVIGPCESGKTVISNFLSDATETSGGEYLPTQGCRILEFEAPNISIGRGKNMNAEIELWDCSGDRKFEACWPALAKDASGIVFVFNPDNPAHEQDLETLMEAFLPITGLRQNHCIAFAHIKPTSVERMRSNLPPQFNKIQTVDTNIEEDSERVREDFNNYLSMLLGAMSERREQEELSIMNSR